MEFVHISKGYSERVTFESGGCRSQIDNIYVRKLEQAMVKDVKVIPDEECINSIGYWCVFRR